MEQQKRGLQLRGYVVGHDDCWQAICLDLDIVAEGHTLLEAKATLDEMVSDYLAEVNQLPLKDQKKLLNRKAPLLTRLGYHLGYFLASVSKAKNRDQVGFILHSDHFAAHCNT